MYADEGYQLMVDLVEQKVVRPNGESFEFDIDQFRKDCLIQGLDEIGLTLQSAQKIKDYEKTRAEQQPWVFGAIK
jgi:3-isopropylmalate/(R)-2-methylmalate dehydratase small subunit